MADIAAILQKRLDEIVNDIREGIDAKGINASGNLKKNLRVNVSNDQGLVRGVITAPAYVFTIDTGRKPTVNSGNGALLPAIRAWLGYKNIPLWAGFKDLDAQARFITYRIHKLGTRRFRFRNERNRIIPDAVPPSRIQDIAEEIAKNTAAQLVQAIRKVGTPGRALGGERGSLSDS